MWFLVLCLWMIFWNIVFISGLSLEVGLLRISSLVFDVSVVTSVIFWWLFLEYVCVFFFGFSAKCLSSLLCVWVSMLLCSCDSRSIVLLFDRLGYRFMLLGTYVSC